MKIIFLSFLLFTSVCTFGQNIFKQVSFKDAVALAGSTGKIIFLQLESLDCEMCNDVYLKAFDNAELVKRLDEGFITIKIDAKHSDRTLVNNLYDLNDKSFGTLFIDGHKNLIHRINATSSLAATYKEELNTAQYKNSEVIKLNIWEDIYNRSKNNNDLERWMYARKNLNLNNDSLLNVYANNLVDDSLNSPRVLTFIASQSPLLNSKADGVLRLNKMFNTVWYAIPLKERISYNRSIISKSMQKAIVTQDENYAFKTASFAGAVNDNKIEARNAFVFQLMKYYEGVSNINRYMVYATQYYDSVLLKKTVADVFRIDSLKQEELKKTATIKSKEVIGNITKVTRSFAFSPTGQQYNNSLNQAAWFVYKNTNDKQYLTKALDWVNKANAYSEKFASLDTEARILYKLGNKDAALQKMEKAIELKNKSVKSPTAFSTLDVVFQHMKEGKADID